MGAVAVGGLSAIGAALYSIGIPKDSIVKYEVALKADKFVLVAHGTAEEVERGRQILATTHPSSLDVHKQCEGATSWLVPPEWLPVSVSLPVRAGADG